jgi:hypothetical protein
VQAAYLLADPSTRRLFNQAIFDGFWIDRETIARSEIKAPFEDMLEKTDASGARHRSTDSVLVEPDPEVWTPTTQALGSNNARTRDLSGEVTGSNFDKMVEPTGIEPVTSCLQSVSMPVATWLRSRRRL